MPGATSMDLQTAIGCSDQTIRRFADKAGVQRPESGKRNHIFPRADVRRILDAVLAGGSRELKKNAAAARAAFSKLWEMPRSQH
jgi:hypothetical protein